MERSKLTTKGSCNGARRNTTCFKAEESVMRHLCLPQEAGKVIIIDYGCNAK
jgi:SAM-dependent MidA family methyltransferase